MRSNRLMQADARIDEQNRRKYTLCYAALLLATLHLTTALIAKAELKWNPAPCGNYPPLASATELLYDADAQRIRLFQINLNVMYECDLAGHWTIKRPLTCPTTRNNYGLTYDSVRKRYLLYGGSTSVRDYLTDTWEWDGNVWTLLSPAHTPEGRYGQVMAYDSKRQRVILFGGYNYRDGITYNDTWEWNGADWKKLTPAQSPPPQYYARLVYDPQRDRMVLFGGVTPSTARSQTNDIWEWDGANWIKCAPAQVPPARISPAMVYDAQRQRVLLQGGSDYYGQPTWQDTWEWDGINWTQRTSLTAPATGAGLMVYVNQTGQAFYTVGMINWWVWDGQQWKETWLGDAPLGRYKFAMAYDSERQRVVLFGGVGLNNRHMQDTWEWDGASWIKRWPQNSPSIRGDHAMAYDAARKRVILFGGHPEDSTLRLGDTWAWDGTNWTQLTPTQSPPAQYGHGMAYDASRQRIVLFSGGTGTWEWDGANWKDCAPTWQPADNGLMAYDGIRKKVLLLNPSGMTMHAWDGANWRQLATGPTPPTRSQAAISCDSATGKILLFGGLTSSYPNPPAKDTWLWDGSKWTQFSTPSAMPPIYTHQMIFDGQSHMLFGGGNYTSIYMQETWLFHPTASVGSWEAFR